jgi:hypothetical protein
MKIKNYCLLFVCSFIFFSELSSQATSNFKTQLSWKQEKFKINNSKENLSTLWTFEEASINPKDLLPYYSLKLDIAHNQKINPVIVNPIYEPVQLDPIQAEKIISNEVQLFSSISQEKNKIHGNVLLMPLRKAGNGFERLISFELKIEQIQSFIPGPRGPQFSTKSILRDGEIYKIAVPEEGVYKLSYEYLSTDLGINLSGLNPSKIQIFGNGGGMLPEPLATDRMDDLTENHIFVSGDSDSSFDPGDFILFFAEGPNKRMANPESKQFEYTTNLYTNYNNYFLKIGSENGKRISSRADHGSAEYMSTSFDDFIHHEEEKINLLGQFGSAQGSGKMWFGEQFTNVREQNLSEYFNFENIVTNEDAYFNALFVARSNISSELEITLNGQSFENTFSPVVTTDIERLYGDIGYLNGTFSVSADNISVNLNFPENNSTSEGWLDYLNIQAKRENIISGDYMRIVDFNSLDFTSSKYVFTNATSNYMVWDITNPLSVISQEYIKNGNNLEFSTDAEGLREFILFNVDAVFPVPENRGIVANQNLHNIEDADMIIIYPQEFESEAIRLAEHRASHSNLIVLPILLDHIYNEFSSGRPDISALRDFSKMIYDRSDRFNYILMFGDASYDYKHILTDLDDQNFVPTYQTDESLYPIGAFPSDDFFGLLSDFEGDDLKGELDVSVGRLPVKSIEEAGVVVDKIISYDTNPNSFGDWRVHIAFAADDEDNNIHLNQADFIANKVENKHNLFNLDKIYFDAFQQVSTPGGNRYPDATESLNNNIFRGSLVLNYLGHGGPKGWSQERVLKIDDINSWTNNDKLSVLITATCSFTGFDDPGLISAGEYAILNEKGGAIALFTTVRAVYSFENKRLTEAVFDTIFTKTDGEYLAMGEIMRRAKNTNWQDTSRTNSRKFFYIGDPSQHLALPKYTIRTTKINENNVGSGIGDTLRALQRVTIEGEVTDDAGNLISNFNGSIFPTVFDKKINVQTLGNDDQSSPKNFTLQKNILFKGAASVTNGKFNFSFVVPKDINYSFGEGKISYYASDGSFQDAAGYYNDIKIGGTDENAEIDDQGPLVDVFINDEDFAFGGITNSEPILLVKLEDDIGINVSNSSIGHELSAIIDENTQNTIILNEYYESDMDNFTKGTVRFPLSELEEGRHTIKVKAYDTANNPGEGYTEFIVTNSEESALSHVLNYPNPFTNSTCFQFEHNLSDTELSILINIYTISGKLVKSIDKTVFADGFREADIKWDGKDDFGDQLAKGVYLYQVKVQANEFDIEKKSEFEKLVILK